MIIFSGKTQSDHFVAFPPPPPKLKSYIYFISNKKLCTYINILEVISKRLFANLKYTQRNTKTNVDIYFLQLYFFPNEFPLHSIGDKKLFMKSKTRHKYQNICQILQRFTGVF